MKFLEFVTLKEQGFFTLLNITACRFNNEYLAKPDNIRQFYPRIKLR